MTDLELRQNVLEELEFEPSTNAAHIGVAACSGVVTLTGQVASFAERQAAVAAVRRVNGVRAIADEIEVRLPPHRKTPDDLIAKRAIDVLAWDPITPSNSIQVLVRNGWVILSGSVEWNFQRQSAEDDVRKLSGVYGVTNNIKIEPRVEAADVQRKIEEALKRHAGIEADAIQVTVVDNNTVVLEGEVDNWEEQNAAENAAWSAPGVKSVDDRLKILRQTLT